jgi:DNA invertase Pin-like site-specific DNA recombinase
MGKRRGYGRVSSRGQQRDGNSLEDQKSKLMAAGCAEEDIVLEAYTGTKMERPMFTALLDELVEGDTLVVTKLDRFARTAADGVKVVKELMARGVSVHVLNMGLVEDTPTGRLILNILLAFAEFERDNIVERLADGKETEKAKNPDYREGRKAFEIPENFEWYRNQTASGDLTVVEACAELGISRSTWYKWTREIAG